MELRFACADFTFPLLPHDHVLDLIAMLGFSGVDIGLFEGRSHLQPSGALTDPTRAGRELGAKLRGRGLQPADIFLQTSPDFVAGAVNHPELTERAKARDAFARTLEFTSECGGRHVSGLPGVYFPGEDGRASFRRCCEELAWRCERAEACGLVFSVEAHVGSIAPTPGEAMHLVESVPGLTLTLDYTHFAKMGIPDAECEPLIAHASHFHARGAAEGRLQTSVSESSIDYVRVVEVMKEVNYPGYVGIEYVWMDWENCNRVDNLSETILLRDLISRAYLGC